MGRPKAPWLGAPYVKEPIPLVSVDMIKVQAVQQQLAIITLHLSPHTRHRKSRAAWSSSIPPRCRLVGELAVIYEGAGNVEDNLLRSPVDSDPTIGLLWEADSSKSIFHLI